jgi:hypothetical protein
VGAHEPADHRGLGLAQLGELRRHVRHRAVVLAELPPAGDRRGRGSVALGGERGGECLRAVDRLAGARADGLLHSTGGTRLQTGQLLLGDRPDGVGPTGGGDVPQGGQRQVVVGVRKGRTPGVGQVEPACGTPPATVGLARQPLLDPPRRDEGVEVSADGGR